MNKNNIDEALIFDMLGIALIEIRAAEKLEHAKKLADIFHNVPARLAKQLPPADILDDMMNIAARYGASNYLDSLLGHSRKKILESR
jgi:hypothetical protein